MSVNFNFSINPNFSPGLHLTAPSILTAGNSTDHLTLRSAALISPSLTIPVDPEISIHEAAARQAFEIAQIPGSRFSNINLLLNDLDNPNIKNHIFLQVLRQNTSTLDFTQICEEVAVVFRGERDAQVGETLITNHFRVILRIKDSNGLNFLEQLAAFYLKKRDHHQGLGELHRLCYQMKSLQARMRSTTTPLVQNTQFLVETADLRHRTVNAFQSLPHEAMQSLCQRIWRLDGEPNRLNYAYDTIVQDIEKVLCHKNTCPLEDAILECTELTQETLRLSASYVHDVEISVDATKAHIQEVRRFYRLEDLHKFLNEPHRNNDFLVSKYQKLDLELSTHLNQLVWRACYQPHSLGFAKNLITNNVRSLLDFKNLQGVDIIAQLLPHYREKIICHQLIAEMEPFCRNASTNNPQQLLHLFNQLSNKAKEDLRYRLWYRDGGSTNPHFGEWYYASNKINREPISLLSGDRGGLCDCYLRELKDKAANADAEMLRNLTWSKTLPNEPIDVSSSPLEREEGLIDNLPLHLRVAFVTAELSGVVSVGGLGPAVEGMVRGLGTSTSSVILPLYENGPIAAEKLQALREKTEYQIEINRTTYKIFKAKINGIRCYFVKDPGLFWIPKKEDGTAGSFYNGDYLTVKRRFAVFQSVAAELVYKLSQKRTPIDLVHCNDAQTGLVPKFLATRHPQEWKEGRTPATVFTFHNTLESNPYDNEETKAILGQHGLPKTGINSFIAALQDSEIVTTVSETYGKEAQTQLFGNRLEKFTKIAAFEGKVVGIVNGNSNGWDPTKERQPDGSILVHRFGPDSPDLGEKIKANQRELCDYLRSRTDEAYADLDYQKPIVLYVGRYDHSQKGIDKLEFIMDEALRNGAQFVCVGTDADDQAKEVLARMKRKAHAQNHRGVLILEDKKVDGTLFFQSDFGSLLRAAASFSIFPSIYEPCGLVQGELNRYGKKVVATKTGGFIDTLNTTNGYLFERLANWHTDEQNEAIAQTLRVAIANAVLFQNALYDGTEDDQRPFLEQTRTIMRNARNSTWERTPDGSLSAIRRLELAYAKAFVKRRKRGQVATPLQTLKI